MNTVAFDGCGCEARVGCVYRKMLWKTKNLLEVFKIWMFIKLLIKPGRNRKTVHETSSATVERNTQPMHSTLCPGRRKVNLVGV